MASYQIPVIDISPLLSPNADPSQVVRKIDDACQKVGFFYISGHGVDKPLQQNLEQLSLEFFNQSLSKKLEISMDFGGKAWRGYFPLEAELTSGKPDVKEGLYFGEDLPGDHPQVTAGIPLHGSNLYPDIEGFDVVVSEYMQQMSRIGAVLMQGMALGLGLSGDYFSEHLMTNPIQLFRIFHYPVPTISQKTAGQWGVGQHTDYGMLTILKQDKVGGLQVFSQGKWINAPYVENSFICNIGDMLDYLTGGYYRSTPHRVFNKSGTGRLSFPFFYDLDFNAVPKPVDLSHMGHAGTRKYDRWDASDLHSFNGTYGEYLIKKVSMVFPLLKDSLI
jgi:isopenicillin N synthase-like dioxygenase